MPHRQLSISRRHCCTSCPTLPSLVHVTSSVTSRSTMHTCGEAAFLLSHLSTASRTPLIGNQGNTRRSGQTCLTQPELPSVRRPLCSSEIERLLRKRERYFCILILTAKAVTKEKGQSRWDALFRLELVQGLHISGAQEPAGSKNCDPSAW